MHLQTYSTLANWLAKELTKAGRGVPRPSGKAKMLYPLSIFFFFQNFHQGPKRQSDSGSARRYRDLAPLSGFHEIGTKGGSHLPVEPREERFYRREIQLKWRDGTTWSRRATGKLPMTDITE